ncbi:MAG: tetratricopeptide repeat protein [Myxococcota bacterium]
MGSTIIEHDDQFPAEIMSAPDQRSEPEPVARPSDVETVDDPDANIQPDDIVTPDESDLVPHGPLDLDAPLGLDTSDAAPNLQRIGPDTFVEDNREDVCTEVRDSATRHATAHRAVAQSTEALDREPSDREPSDREPSDREPSDREPSDREPTHDPSTRSTADRLEADLFSGTIRHRAIRKPSEAQPVGKRLGRFTVLGTLGRGGMGKVLRAYDETLDRMVALKLLYRRFAGRRKQRLLREAQALAKLSHPNVVQVYEMGEVDGQTFIAMELVSGQTFRTWQRERRSWRETLDVYLQAGYGLAAAHAEGLVHRDFKPENCIIGNDQRVRVLDFGLVRGTNLQPDEEANEDHLVARFHEPSEPLDDINSSGARGSLDHRLTRSGAVMGTMCYLPLQQLSGEQADAQSDQYSFCTSLYEALYGMRPFDGSSLSALIRSLENNELLPVPKSVTIPKRLRRILLRGLAKLPEDRWPTMDELLAELERLRQPRRWWLTATVALAAGLGVGGLALASAREDPCPDPEAGLDGAWQIADQEAVRAAFVASEHPEALELYGRVEAQLDAYTEAWVQQAEQSCRATFVDRQQSQALFDRRMQCLQRRRNRLRTTIDSIAAAVTAHEVVDRTILPFKLPPLEICSDVEVMMARQSPPSDPQRRNHVAQLRERIDHANTLREAGEVTEGLALAEIIAQDARAVDYPPVLAEAMECLGHLQSAAHTWSEAQGTLENTIEIAARAKSDEVSARAWALMIYVLMNQSKFDDGLLLERSARAAVDRADDATARGWLLNNLGALYAERGELDQANRYLRDSLHVKQEALGEGHVDVGVAWFNLGRALQEEGSTDSAMKAFERARTVFQGTVGDSHPYVAFVMAGLGKIYQRRGETSKAADYHHHALAIRQAALDPKHPLIASSLQELGELALAQGRFDDAQQHLEHAQMVNEQAHGPKSIQVAATLLVLAKLGLAQSQPEAARAYAERAVSINAAVDVPPRDRAEALMALARSLWPDPKARPRARALAQQAKEVLASGPAPARAMRKEVEAWLAAHAVPAGTETSELR